MHLCFVYMMRMQTAFASDEAKLFTINFRRMAMKVNHFAAAIFAAAITTVPVPVISGLGATPAFACDHKADCNKSTDGVQWNGKGRMPNLIHGVTVCHSYWDRLNVGTYRGVRTKWWAPTMVRAGWYGDLPVYTTQCTTFADFTPGTEVRVYASCVSRVITTGPIYRPGTYYLS